MSGLSQPVPQKGECGTCKWYRATQQPALTDVTKPPLPAHGTCFLNPPVMHLMMVPVGKVSNQLGLQQMAVLPTVQAIAMCQHWAPKITS